MVHVIGGLVLIGLGFGLGRVKHPSNLKLANIKAEIVKLEAEVMAAEADVAGKLHAVVARIKALL